eukprot:717457_1
MSSSRFLILILACVLFEINAATNIIDPTATNSSESSYIASEYYNDGQYFRNGSLTCNALYCHIVCDVELGCQSLSVYATSSLTTLVIQCLEYHSCYQANIEANTVNVAELYCDDGTTSSYGACRELSLHVSDVSTASVYCGYYDCRDANIFANNIANSLNVTCDSDYACYGADIHVTGETKRKLNLDCATSLSASCLGTLINCTDTPFHSMMSYSYTTTDWSCNNYACCPISSGYIACDPGSPCQIECHNETCTYIDATTATSLSLSCGEYACRGAVIKCPTGVNASCDIHCSGPRACEYAYVPASANNMKVECNATYSCQNMALISSSSDISSLYLDCTGPYGCDNMEFTALTIIDTAILNCIGAYSCGTLQFTTSAVIDTLA